MQIDKEVEAEKRLPLAKPRQISLEEKLDYCAKWKKSGLTKVKFCKAKNIPLSQFKYWYRHFYAKEENKKQASQWTPVVTPAQSAIPSERRLQLELALPNQLVVRVEISAHYAVTFIQELSHAIAIIR